MRLPRSLESDRPPLIPLLTCAERIGQRTRPNKHAKQLLPTLHAVPAPGVSETGTQVERPGPSMPKSKVSPPTHAMDTEQINTIGTLLADLSARTEQLRGYL